MAYRLDAGEPIEEAVRRIGSRQLRRGVRSLDRADTDSVSVAVFDARKRCRKVRSLLRLVREPLGERYRPANRTLRDAARLLSDLRDDVAMIDALDLVINAEPDRVPTTGLGPLRNRLIEESTSRDRVEDPLALIEQAMALVNHVVEDATWQLACDNGWEAVGQGLETEYRLGRDALASLRATAEGRRSVEELHDFRKNARHTRNHLRLVMPLAPTLIEPLAVGFHDLSRSLGLANDLAVLIHHLQADPARFSGQESVDAAVDFLDDYRRRLEHRALIHGQRLYAESPARFARRLGAYWDTWQHDSADYQGQALWDPRPVTDSLSALTVPQLQTLAAERGVPRARQRLRADLLTALRAG